MKLKILQSISLTLLGVTLIAQTPSITIDASNKGAQLSRNLYGIFFEEINHAGDGGIYGELIRNRGFEENRTPEDMTWNNDFLYSKAGWKHYYKKPDSLAGWSLKLSGAGSATIHQVAANPLNEKNPMSMLVDVKSPGNNDVEVVNSGFWGISVIQNDSYSLSFYAHCNKNFKGSLKVQLKGSNGKVLAENTIQGISDKWKKFSCKLSASNTDAKATFVIIPLSQGQVWFDLVSLFPEKTFKGRENGMRNDLATLINDFRPGFIRFPGGCIVEGATLNNRVKWENTIGDISQRPGHWVLWDYHSTDGIGFHEFLQFCEDLHCPAMYVVSVGMSCQFRKCEYVSAEHLQPYIDEVMNALEYALGPVTSRWGAERAKNGHPASFNVKYVEIGNENYGTIYQEHYNYFYKAIKEKYPQITTIACTDPGTRDAFKRNDLSGITENIEIIDEHFYESPDFFYRNAFRYDNYDRNGPKIYCGEYAVKKWDNSLRGNLDAALAEAAFMTGFERNGDLVQMSSQAPTFVNDNDRTWNPDLLIFNSSQAFGNPSYQVQKLFSTNIPDYSLPTKVENSGYKVNPVEKGAGMVGFSNFGAFCRYKDVKIKVAGKEFSGSAAFTAETMEKIRNGSWEVDKKSYTELQIKPEVYAYAGTNGWDNYTLSLKAYADSIDDLEGFTVLFYTTGWGKHYKWNIGRWNRYYWLQWYDNSYESYFGQQPGNITTGKWYDITIQYHNDSVYAFLDDKLIHAVKAPDKVTPGIYSTAGMNADGSIVLKVVNPTDKQVEIAIDINGSKIIYGKVHSQVISGERNDENTFSEPLKISPVTSQSTIPGNKFNYTFKPRSVTVLTFSK